MHGLAGAVAVTVGPALHGGPGDLEAGGDLANRPIRRRRRVGRLSSGGEV